MGAAFTEAFSNGVCKREEIFVTSKLWNTFHRKDDVSSTWSCIPMLTSFLYLELYTHANKLSIFRVVYPC